MGNPEMKMVNVREYERAGFYVVRGALRLEEAVGYAKRYAEHRATYPVRKVNPWNPVEVTDYPDELMALPELWQVRSIASDVMGPMPNLYNFRLVVKDRDSRAPVQLHQDISYHCGGMVKCSVFLALTACDAYNGGLRFYPGTHHYGHLGDAGEIDFAQAPLGVCPTLAPGDAVVMNSYTWHDSDAHFSGPDRLVADMIFQPAKDHSRAGMYESWFVRNRVSRLKELTEQLQIKARAGE